MRTLEVAPPDASAQTGPRVLCWAGPGSLWIQEANETLSLPSKNVPFCGEA